MGSLGSACEEYVCACWLPWQGRNGRLKTAPARAQPEPSEHSSPMKHTSYHSSALDQGLPGPGEELAIECRGFLDWGGI